MKRALVLMIMVAVYMVTGCSENDDNSGTTLQGRWNLIQVAGGFGGESEQYQRGEITWSFNENNNTIVVTDNRLNSPEPTEPLTLPEGTHNYTIEADGEVCDEALHSNDMNFGCIIFHNNQLHLSMDHADGAVYTFIR
ncbi:MAG TPA: hypothetical protein VEA37_13830 [Flavobacterium sp.]|nr:hypothetical protein [Flavobacterium sp.]